MFTKEAIQEIAQSSTVRAVAEAHATAISADGSIALPNDFALHDLERYMPTRRRARGTMETSSIADFAAYVIQHQEAGAAVFVSPSAMVANAVLNLGTPTAPGHADNRAQFKPRATAAYSALAQVANGQPMDQQRAAEFLEDWAHVIKCFHEADELSPGKAVSAVRSITIDALRKVEATEKQLSASKSAFESVTASSTETLPTYVYFTCVPYHEFEERTFVMRLGIRTTDKPALTLRIINREQHDEYMASELRAKVDAAIPDGLPVLVGDYSAKS
jgi:uncharacterized protein YfdQ (DUF2303 family)